MSEAPWLTIVGLGEDGAEGLSPASVTALNAAEIVMGPARHLSLLPSIAADTLTWPVPFADGIEKLLALRGRRVVVLASGDPFWFGAGSVLAHHLNPTEWRALPGASCFSLAANHLGWPLERTPCLGLHAAPVERLRPHLWSGARLIATLRDGKAVANVAQYLARQQFEASTIHVLHAMGGPRETIRTLSVADAMHTTFSHPLCVGIDVSGDGRALPSTSGIDDTWFDNDGQITKRPVRALTLSALAPKPGEHLWDIGGGSGSIAIEWLLSHPTMKATAFEVDAKRAERLTQNAAGLGQDHLSVIHGHAPEAFNDMPRPDAVFIGGGLSQHMLDTLKDTAPGTRLVANAVTLESEALLTAAQAEHGGSLLRVELAEAAPLGRKRGWRSAYPIVQWSVTL